MSYISKTGVCFNHNKKTNANQKQKKKLLITREKYRMLFQPNGLNKHNFIGLAWTRRSWNN